MADHGISWLNCPGRKGETWNPIIGCGGCELGKRCYAWKFAARLAGQVIKDYDEVLAYKQYQGCTRLIEKCIGWNGQCRLIESRLNDPFHWSKPRLVFVNSMGDFFADNVREDWIDNVLEAIEATPKHQYIILTKKPQNIQRKMYDTILRVKEIRFLGGNDILLNLWVGVSATNKLDLDERLSELNKHWKGKKLVSIEPILNKINLDTFRYHCIDVGWKAGVDWVISGPETGPDKRPYQIEWARSLAEQCLAAGIPFFWKGPETDLPREWPDEQRLYLWYAKKSSTKPYRRIEP